MEKSGVAIKIIKNVTMIISCESVLESSRRGASNTLPYDFIIELAIHVIGSSTPWEHHSHEYTRIVLIEQYLHRSGANR